VEILAAVAAARRKTDSDLRPKLVRPPCWWSGWRDVCNEDAWKRAYREINDFERQLVDAGGIV